MNKIYKNLIKSFLFGMLIFFGFGYTLGIIFNGDFAGVAIVGISIISTIVFCTYTIIDTIKEYCDKWISSKHFKI